MTICSTARDFFAERGGLMQEYFVHFKSNQGNITEKGPPFGFAAIFQTGLKLISNDVLTWISKR